MNELIKEYQSFCDRYIKTAENEWAKTDNQVDLAAATVGKIMLNKFNELFSRHSKDTEPKEEGLREWAKEKAEKFHPTKDTEPLAVLIKGLVDIGECVCHADGYLGPQPCAICKARQYLNGLPDKADREDK